MHTEFLRFFHSFSFFRHNNGYTYIIYRRLFFKITSYLAFNVFLQITVFSQDSINNDYTVPLDIPLSISGNFGDVRDNTFHFGIDFRTNEKEGYPLFAVEDGYISRIKIEPGGYGIAAYINHANGITSVYAHMRNLKKNLAEFIINEQYRKHTFQLDIELPADSFKIKKCDTIGFSGNKGLSSGPHLHFELRKTISQNPINCLSNGIYLTDSLPPVFQKLWIYENRDYIPAGNSFKKSYDITHDNENYIIKNNDTILLSNNSGFGIEAYDYVTDTFSQHSFYSQKLYIDTSLWFETLSDEISFEQVSYINAFIDYAENKSNHSIIYKLFSWPNQDLMFDKMNINNGLINLQDTFIHKLKIVLNDNSGNTSNLDFKVKYIKDNDTVRLSSNHFEGKILNWKHENTVQNQFIKIYFPINSLYSNIDFTFKQTTYRKSSFSPVSKVFKIGSIYIPLKKQYYISFPLNNVVDPIRKKLLIASIDKKGNLTSIGGNIHDNTITSTAKVFGTYAVFADTIPPVIKPINISNGKNMIKEDCIKILINDELSGIQEYNGMIDKQWVLFEYNSKNSLLSYGFDSIRFAANNNYHLLELLVSDKKGNKRKYMANFKK
jgi:murein DD-endopeptidase MepM/ murein hydrolase activator NlpD